MAVEAPVTRITAAAYRIPTDAPEADGTTTWEATTVVVGVEAGGETGLGRTYGAAAAAGVVEELLAPHICTASLSTPPAATRR
jgi:hypothetical protein